MDRPYAYSRTDYAPLALNGWYQWNSTTGNHTAVDTLVDPASFTNVPSDDDYDENASYDQVLAAEDD
jgi:hypothetical protein